MKNQLDKAIRRVMAARHAEHRRAAVLVILALLTILSVSWRLHQVGIAMTDDEYSCGYEEHVHSDACYTEVLIQRPIPCRRVSIPKEICQETSPIRPER